MGWSKYPIRSHKILFTFDDLLQYNYKPERIIEDEKVKTLWDMKIKTDKVTQHSRLDMVVLSEEDRICSLVVVACSFDTKVVRKEGQKLENYTGLKCEIKIIWNCQNYTYSNRSTGSSVETFSH